MANKLDELIEQVRENNDSPAEFLQLLESARAEIPDDASESYIDEVVKKIISGLLRGRLENDDDNLSDDDREYMEEVVSVVRELFADEHWRYSEDSLGASIHIFDLVFAIQGCRLRIRVYIETDPKVCRIDAILPISADETYEYVLCKKIVKSNYPRRYGALHYDEKDGEVSYRYSFPISHGLYKDDLKKAFIVVTSSAAENYEEIKRCCVGKFKSKEINEILKKVNRLVNDLRDDE